jgi:hypothetical protein
MLAFVPVAVIALPLGRYLRHPIPPRQVPVTGIITFRGAPLIGATVAFFHADLDRGLAGAVITDVTGRYSMITIRGADGMLPGSYKVSISGGYSTCPWVPPTRRHVDPATSGLVVDVVKDTPVVFNLNLTMP